LLATLAQIQAGILDWMLVERIRAHRAEFSSDGLHDGDTLGAADGLHDGDTLGAVDGFLLGIRVGDFVGVTHSLTLVWLR
jgi:hypothetical protein